ncbi:MAG: tetratricopeptide repeat protein, partial [Akkermansiaceae bacterium]
MIRSILISILALTCIASAQKDERTKASKLYQQDNYAEALTIYEKLLTDHNDTKSGNDLLQAVQCLKKLNRTPEVDALLEKSIAAQPKNYRLLRQASHHFSTLPHYGYIIAGEFNTLPFNCNAVSGYLFLQTDVPFAAIAIGIEPLSNLLLRFFGQSGIVWPSIRL